MLKCAPPIHGCFIRTYPFTLFLYPQKCKILVTSVAAAILGGYSGLISIAVLRSKMKGSPEPAAEAPAAVEAAPASTGDVLPSVESPDFEKFLNSDAFGKFVESEESLMKWVDSVAAK